MALATFPMIVKRWRRSKLHSESYDQYTQLKDYLPEDIFLSRMQELNSHMYTQYPHIWIDTYLFFTAVVFVIGAATFSIIARAVNLSMWYPLIMLLIPGIIAYFTTKRRNVYYKKLANYYESLQSVIKVFNSLDVTRQIKWNFRRLRETDTAESMHLNYPVRRFNITFIIEVVQIDPENELAQEGEALPAYDTSMMDIVLDIGPETERPINDIALPPQAIRRTVTSHPLPPAYEHNNNTESSNNHESIEMEPIQPPPAYLPEPTTTTTNNNNRR